MGTASTHNVTGLLLAWNEGDPVATERLLPLIYDRLRELARASMRREHGDPSLQSTALVHEAYLRLVDGQSVAWQGRAHFYNLAARAMRRILVDHARHRQSLRRGGKQPHVPLEEAEPVQQPKADSREADLVALDDALTRFAETYPRQSKVVEMRFFAGMEGRDIAEVLQVNERTVKRDWQFAKNWLHREIGLPATQDEL